MIRDMERSRWRRVSEIYTQGLANGTATFETVCPSYDDWDRRHLQVCRYVAVEEDNVVGWIAVSPTSSRPHSKTAKSRLRAKRSHSKSMA